MLRLRWFLRKFRLGISRSDKVLDVGSGHDPFFRADVICDKFLFDNVERMNANIKIDRPFVVCDAEALPFVEGAFDYVISSHLLEHLNYPEDFLEEIMRVGKRGYIETPSEFSEKFGGLTTHKWFVRQEGDKLILTPKNKPIFDLSLKQISDLLQNNYDFKVFSWKNPIIFNVTYHWQKKIKYELRGHLDTSIEDGFVKSCLADTASPSPDLVGVNRSTFFEKAKSLFKSFLYLLYKDGRVNLFDILACPKCKKKVVIKDDTAICLSCEMYYQIKSGIPIMLKESARPIKKI